MRGQDARDKKRPGCTLSRVCTLGPQAFPDSATFSWSGSKTTSTTRPVSAILSLSLPRYHLARRLQRHILGVACTPAKGICRLDEVNRSQHVINGSPSGLKSLAGAVAVGGAQDDAVCVHRSGEGRQMEVGPPAVGVAGPGGAFGGEAQGGAGSATSTAPVARPRPRGSPSQHVGYLRAVLLAAGVASAVWRPAKVLVDSGSQQPPLLSGEFARRLGCQPGAPSGAAAQADGSLLRLYSVGPVELCVNGRPQRTLFHTANFSPYDCILGESWLRQQRGILNYDTGGLWRGGGADPTPLRLDLPPVSLGEAAARVSTLLHPMGSCRSRVLQSGLGLEWRPSACSRVLHGLGSRGRRLQRRHGALAPVTDDCKALPEDEELDLGELPGVVPAARTSFSYVEEDVRFHLRHLPPETTDALVKRLRRFEPDVFETRDTPRPPPRRQLDLDVTLKDDTPIYKRPYAVAPHHIQELDRQIQVLLKAGIIRHSVSEYGSPVLFAPKADGSLRLCVDYRELNARTVRDRFPTPTAGDLIARTRGAKMFSKIDLLGGFHQLRIRETDCHKTAFVTPTGHYEWVSAPFGLTATPSAFQRLMTFVLRDHIQAGYCVVYIDDVCIFTKTDDPEEHLAKVEAVLASLAEHELLAKGKKCEFFRSEMEFLGFMVSADGVAPVPGKVEAIRQVPPPETVSQLRSFLGMANFFRSHLPAFSEVSAPLTDLLRHTTGGRQRLPWTLECDQAFQLVKDMLTSAPLLRHFDPGLRTAVHVDASQNAVGAVLLQWAPGETVPRPVEFFSRKLQGSQFRYDGRNAEALAIQLSLAHWRPLLYGVKFELCSDHFSLTQLMRQRAIPSQRLLRLCEFLADFDFDEIQHIAGKDNLVPDFLSRPYNDQAPDVNLLHVLTHPRVPSSGSLHVLCGQTTRSVLILPVHGPRLGVWQAQGVLRLPGGAITAGETPLQAAARVLVRGSHEQRLPRFCVVGELGSVTFVRADFQQLPDDQGGCLWFSTEVVSQPRWWLRAHFEALPQFGLFSSGSNAASVCSLPAGPLPLFTGPQSPTWLPDLQAAQEADPWLAQVLKEVRQSDSNGWRDFSELQLGSVKVLCYQRPEDPQPRMCVPLSMRKVVLEAAHGEVLTGHPGTARTAAAVARHFYWPSLYADVANFVRSCPTCIAAKSATNARLGVESFSSVPVQPFSHWAMDLIGPLPKTKMGNEWIVTWVDRTSKTIVAEAARTGRTSTKDLASMTFRHICCRFGLPLTLTHDNDVRFRSLWRALWDLLGTKIKCTSAHNPQSDPAERANRQILKALRAAVSTVGQYDEWDEALPHICFGLNTHPSSTTQTSPFELAHGFAARVPMTWGIPSGPWPSERVAAHDMALAVQNRLCAAADQVAASQVRIGRLLNRRYRPAALRPGDWVWLDGAHNTVGGIQIPAKLAARWFGPYQVLEVKPGGAAVRLDLPPELGNMSDVVNIRRLRFDPPRDAALDDGSTAAPQPLLGADGLPRWEVRRILAHRIHNRRPELFVEWKGFDTSRATWEHRDGLMADVPDLVRAYEANPSVLQARASAPKRPTKGRQLPARVQPSRAARGGPGPRS